MALTRFQDVEQIGENVERLSKKLEQLRVIYEQYFIGLEKQEPRALRDEVAGLIRRNTGVPVQNARMKFRLQQTIARYNTFTTYWDRVLRQIEDGTYERDRFKALIHEKARKKMEQEEGKKKDYPVPSAASRNPADAVAGLFQRYVQAKEKNGESVASLSLDRFRSALRGQIDALKQKTHCQSVRMDVVTEGGKVRLKAAPVSKKTAAS